MPRLPTRLIRQAWNINPLLPLLLRECRNLPSARNELRWIKEHIASQGTREQDAASELLKLCRRRARGEPLQYIIGSQPFGDLDILCRRGVLIPRPETESYTAHLADLVLQDANDGQGFEELRILDLCTGTGAIPLSLYASLADHFKAMKILGVDLSEQALKLAAENLKHNEAVLPVNAAFQISFARADVLRPEVQDLLNGKPQTTWDIVISNPPYISKSSFWKDTSRSARLFEPLSALVPQNADTLSISPHLQPEDIFYPAVLNIAVSASARIVLMEVADLDQASRVARHALAMGHFSSVEIWRDWPMDLTANNVLGKKGEEAALDLQIMVIGSGNGRSVVCRRT